MRLSALLRFDAIQGGFALNLAKLLAIDVLRYYFYDRVECVLGATHGFEVKSEWKSPLLRKGGWGGGCVGVGGGGRHLLVCG